MQQISGNIESIQLKSLLRITRAISHVSDLHSLITLLASETSKVLDVDRSTVFLYSTKTDELWSYVAEGETEEIRFSASEGIAGSVFRNCRTLILQDVTEDERFNNAIDETTGFVTRNMITAPIINPSGQCIGVFQVINKKSGNFSATDAEFLEIVSSETAVTIENVRLLESRKLLRCLQPGMEGQRAKTGHFTEGINRRGTCFFGERPFFILQAQKTAVGSSPQEGLEC